jgi:hypothetical protein
VTGAFLGNWLTIARADGSAVFNGGVTMNAGASVNGLFALSSLGNFYLPGGTAGQFLSTNGSGILSWATPAGGGGGIAEAPNDGTAYARKSLAWAHLTHTDITDWTATLAPYALTTAVPVASTTLPLVDGVAAIGVGTTFARADHVHPLPPQAMGDNRIINGDMRIDQRNNGASGTTQSVYTIDRWFYNSNAIYGTWQRGTLSPAAFAVTGFGYCWTFASTSAHTSAAGDYSQLFTPLEGDAVSDFKWGTANAQPVTLSFWATSSKTGTFSAALQNYAGTRSYPFTYSLPTANTWTFITITIPGDTAGTWVMSGNGGGVALNFDLGSGTTYRGVAGAWVTGNIMGVTGAVSVLTPNGASFYLTGVKLEIGSVATPFNRQSLAKSMADCQRYYAVFPSLWLQVYCAAGSIFDQMITLPVTMRASPTVALVGPTYSNASGGGSTTISSAVLGFYAVATALGMANITTGLTASAEL